MVNLFVKFLPSKPVFAHCDIPCGIYDPHQAQLAAHTVIRMTKLIKDQGMNKGEKDEESEEDWIKMKHDISRMTYVKEEHADLVEEELVTLWADYFKEEHLKEYPELNNLILKTVKLTGKVRQEINMEAAEELLKNVQEIAEIFWKTKGMTPVRIPSGYPTEGVIVSHK
ncbi:MAG: superoxide dismutase, Ni [Candidatus Daviesbacteria bacterium]|nr:superoxide dismutase, Ni [Candidatus Daviesbacteria bacterium]